MFKNLFKLEIKRTPVEAVGFYFAYLLFVMLIAVLSAFLFTGFDSSMNFNKGFQVGMVIGQYIAVGVCLLLSFLILFKKKRAHSFGLVLVALLSGVFAIFLGGLLGLIPAAYLTTVDKP